jgi:Gpi18-like mannosyltransferase
MRRRTSSLSNRDKFFGSVAVAAVGMVLLLYTLLSLFRLSEGTVEGKLVLAVLTGALYALAVALLRREGCNAATLLLLFLPLSLGFFLRVQCMDYVSADYQSVLAPWVDLFRDSGAAAAMKQSFGPVSVPTLYLLGLLSLLPLHPLYSFKLCLLLFDLLLAWGGMRIVRVFRPKSRLPEAAFLLLFLLPTVDINGALCGQWESIFAAFSLLSLASLLERHPRRSLVFAGLAFCIHPQAFFLLPLLLAVWLLLRLRPAQLIFFPLTCLVLLLPALLLGKPLGELLSFPFQFWTSETVENPPSLSAFLPAALRDQLFFSVVGVLLALLATAALFLFCLRMGRHLRDQELIPMALLFSMVLPFLLPHMSERSFFLACVLSVPAVCIDLQRLPIAALLQLAVLGSYYASLMGTALFPMPLAALLVLASLLLLAQEYLPQGSLRALPQRIQNLRIHSAPMDSGHTRKNSRKIRKNG